MGICAMEWNVWEREGVRQGRARGFGFLICVAEGVAQGGTHRPSSWRPDDEGNLA